MVFESEVEVEDEVSWGESEFGNEHGRSRATKYCSITRGATASAYDKIKNTRRHNDRILLLERLKRMERSVQSDSPDVNLVSRTKSKETVPRSRRR